MRALCVIALCGLTALTAAAEDKKTVRVVKVPDGFMSALDRGKVSEPTVIKSEEEFHKVFGKDAKAEVDFKKEHLALFQWSGSGQDKLSHVAETKDGKTVVTTTLMPGRTRDLRSHVELIALPAGAEWKFGK
ncbi:MAG: hypothetical protein MUF18_19530 [Fimbriiglobus sp.]|jgi:hypothetical protein|nr:hypothetical protein [Fimbriiglobus sp.]